MSRCQRRADVNTDAAPAMTIAASKHTSQRRGGVLCVAVSRSEASEFATDVSRKC